MVNSNFKISRVTKIFKKGCNAAGRGNFHTRVVWDCPAYIPYSQGVPAILF